MAKCVIRERAARFGSNVSHLHRRSNRIWKVNVRSAKVKMEGGVRKMYIYISCLRLNFAERT